MCSVEISLANDFLMLYQGIVGQTNIRGTYISDAYFYLLFVCKHIIRNYLTDKLLVNLLVINVTSKKLVPPYL